MWLKYRLSKAVLPRGETLDETLRELEIVEDLWLETAKKSGIKYPRIRVEIDRVIEKMAA